MLASAIDKFYLKLGFEVFSPTHKELDVLNFKMVNSVISSFRPDYVFHTAALHVEACEENPDLALKTNALASQNIAKICQRIGSKLGYISSCGLFSDQIKYYNESDRVVLKTVYARTKYEGEAYSIKECENTFVIRPGWLFGGSISHKKNFVFQRYRDAKNSPVLKSAKDKFGCPTYIDDLVSKIDEIIKMGKSGIYHVTNSGGCSRAEYVKKIIDCCNLEAVVEFVDSGSFPRKANVPDCELLENLNIKSLRVVQLPPWEDAIERYTKIMLREIK